MSFLSRGEAGSDGGGGDGSEPPQAKRQRTTGVIDDETSPLPCVGGPIEDDETARQRLRDAGFDPENITDVIAYDNTPLGVGSWYNITPMTYFCFYGDLPMCRYLFLHGASTKSPVGRVFWFPMYAAANRGHFGVCKWLAEHGAVLDIGKKNDGGHRPLRTAAKQCSDNLKYIELSRWLILNGAVHNGAGEIDTDVISEDLDLGVDERPRFLSWAEDVLNSYDGFQAFLMGTLAPSESLEPSLGPTRRSKTRYLSRFRSSVRCLSGNTGVLECIATFVGIVRDSREIRIHGQFVESLRAIMKKDPRGQGSSDDEGQDLSGSDASDESDY